MGGRERSAGTARALCALRASQLICGARTEHRAPVALPARGEQDGGAHRGDYGISTAQTEAEGRTVGVRARVGTGAARHGTARGPRRRRARHEKRHHLRAAHRGEKAEAPWVLWSVLVDNLKQASDPASSLEVALKLLQDKDPTRDPGGGQYRVPQG